jgi:hypothetical protein
VRDALMKRFNRVIETDSSFELNCADPLNGN